MKSRLVVYRAGMRKLFIGLAALVLLSACAQQRLREQVQAAKAQRSAAISACAAEIPKQPGNFVRRAECMNSADQAWAADPSTRDGDLALAIDARRLDLADKADRGEISPVQYEAQLQAVVAEAMSLSQQRSAADAQRQQTAGLALMQWNAMQQQQQQQMLFQQQQQYRAFQFQQPQSINCSTNYVGTTAYTHCQ